MANKIRSRKPMASVQAKSKGSSPAPKRKLFPYGVRVRISFEYYTRDSEDLRKVTYYNVEELLPQGHEDDNAPQYAQVDLPMITMRDVRAALDKYLVSVPLKDGSNRSLPKKTRDKALAALNLVLNHFGLVQSSVQRRKSKLMTDARVSL